MTSSNRRLNDAFRIREQAEGTVIYSAGIKALPKYARNQIARLVKDYTAFDSVSDVTGDHANGTFTVETYGTRKHAKDVLPETVVTIVWAITSTDKTGVNASADTTNLAITKRVLTIKLSTE